MSKNSLIYLVLLSMLIVPGIASAQDAPPGLQAIEFPSATTTPPEVTAEQDPPEEEPTEPPSIEVVPAPPPAPAPLPAPPPAPVPLPVPAPVPIPELPDTGSGLFLSLIPTIGYVVRKKLN